MIVGLNIVIGEIFQVELCHLEQMLLEGSRLALPAAGFLFMQLQSSECNFHNTSD